MKAIQKSAVLFLLPYFLVLAVPQAAAASNPTELVKHSINDVLAIVKDASLNQEERRQQIRKRIRFVVDQRFDFRSMSQSVMATHWQQASAYERDRFVDFFAQSLENTYMGAIESYTDEKIRFVGETVTGERAVVDTVIISKKADIPVSYRMKLKDGEWHTYDVVIENVSLVSNYRNLYAQIINNSGINGLLDEMEGKLALAKGKRRTQGGLDLSLP